MLALNFGSVVVDRNVCRFTVCPSCLMASAFLLFSVFTSEVTKWLICWNIHYIRVFNYRADLSCFTLWNKYGVFGDVLLHCFNKTIGYECSPKFSQVWISLFIRFRRFFSLHAIQKMFVVIKKNIVSGEFKLQIFFLPFTSVENKTIRVRTSRLSLSFCQVHKSCSELWRFIGK